MNEASIGVFDSGMGGLTVMRALTARLPRESFLYLGDTARLPYGTKSADTVKRYALQASRALMDRGVHMEAKPFSIGVRIEHPQSLIDRARFGKNAGHPLLGAADYKLVHHCGNGRSAYSFCMCPGGTVVAATSEIGRVVTNGMSQYSRNERNANSAIVVGVSPADFPGTGDGNPLAGIAFQRYWESRAFDAGGSTYAAPAQRVGDEGFEPPTSSV